MNNEMKLSRLTFFQNEPSIVKFIFNYIQTVNYLEVKMLQIFNIGTHYTP